MPTPNSLERHRAKETDLTKQSVDVELVPAVKLRGRILGAVTGKRLFRGKAALVRTGTPSTVGHGSPSKKVGSSL